MRLITLLAAAAVAADPMPTLILEKLRPVEDPRLYDLRNDTAGDRGVPTSCALANDISVTLEMVTNGTTLTVERDGEKKTITVENTAGIRRSTLACGAGDDFYYANPRLGDIYAYSASRLFRGEDPVVWTRRVEPFKSRDDVSGVITDTSVATALQLRGRFVLVEWLFRKDGTTGFWHEIFDAATGNELDKIGPSDLLLKLNERDSWWIAFQGGGNELVNYVPQNLYRLKYGPGAEGAEPAARTLETLRKSSSGSRGPLTRVSPNPVINHMIALLSPTRTSKSSAIEFCPVVPASRARNWMGSEYDELLAEVSRNVLLAVWADRQVDGDGNPLDVWFQAEVASTEPMKTLLARFNPQDDAWVIGYQQALQKIAGPTLKGWLEDYGTSKAGVRTSADGGPR